MAISTEFKNAVAQNKLIRVRIMLKDNMVIDPTLKEFNEMLKYAEHNLSNLYDNHDGEELNYDESAWNKSYMDEEMVALVNNFSKERIKLLQKMVNKIYGKRIQNIEANRNKNNNTLVHLTRKQVGVGMTAGGVAVIAVGFVIAKEVVVAAGAVTVAAGIVTTLTDR